MYAPTLAEASPATIKLEDLSEEDEVSGIVTKVSQYGVFVDIGAGVDAFLHRRKMKINKKQVNSIYYLYMCI